ncbi:MAG TPA: 6-bladed beta-propeller [Nitrospirota bacterium]|jgi:DNA-binding beta-propeller fold protein YncE
MSFKRFGGRLRFLVVIAAVLSMSATVFSAQDSVRAPVWVGIYTTAGKVGLKWSATAGAARYQVYRSISSGRGRELIATTTDVSYIDASVRPGETYYYALRTVSAEGKESYFSEERYIKVPLTGGGIPVKPPEWVGILTDEKTVRLAWLPSPSSNAVAYNIYKSNEKDKGFQLIGSTQDASLVDTDVKEGETYYYALTTLDKDFKETKFSEVRSIVFQPQKPEGAVGGARKPGPGPGQEPPVSDKIIAKPTRIIGFILKGKDDKPLYSPSDVVIGSDGNVYVSDTGRSLVQVYKQGGEFVRAVGGYGAREGKFEKLLGCDVDKEGNIYGVDAYTGWMQKFNGEGRLLLRKCMRVDGKAIAEDLGLKVPVTLFGVVKPVVAPDGNIYILDNYNDCIEIYNQDGRYLKTFGGKGVGDGKFQGPTFAVFGPDGQLFVVDCLNARVQVFDKNGAFLWKFGSYGNVMGTFSRPKGIALDGLGRIYVADSMSNVIQVFDKDGRFLFLLADERGKQIDLGTPNGIALDKKKRIYMVEKLVNRIQIRQVGE